MAGLITDAGGLYILDVIFSDEVKPTSFTMQLFTDSANVADSDINTTHTVAAGGDYSDASMSNNATISSVGGIPTATFPSETFTFSGPLDGNVSVKGYQVLQGTTLLFLEKFANPYTPSVAGDTLVVSPSFRLGNGTPT